MEISMDKSLSFVNTQIEFHSERASQYSGTRRAIKHAETRDKLKELKEFIIELGERPNQPGSAEISPKQLSLNLSPKDIENLPDDLMQELSVSKDKLEFVILSAMEDNGGFSTLDQLLVSIYKKTGEIMKRTTLNNRLYRMAQKETIYSVPDKKGVYSLEPLEAGDIDHLIDSYKKEGAAS